jgi:hypothetical protein
MLIDSVAFAAIKQQRLLASDPKVFDHFGWSVTSSGDGNIIAVGAPFADQGANADQGSADIFLRSGSKWIQQQKVTSSDGAAFDRFGWSLSISGDGKTMVVGAPYHKVSGKSEQGAAYVFARNGGQWTQQQELTASDGSVGDRFGCSVSISSDGNIIVIGAPFADVDNRNDQGSAYVFVQNKGQWIQKQKLTALNGSLNDHFGQSVSISGSGNVTVSGAHDKNIDRNTSQGSVYILSEGLVPDITMKELSIILTVLTGCVILYYLMRRKKEKN